MDTDAAVAFTLDATPEESWDIDRLGEFCSFLHQKSAIDIWLLGRALLIAKSKLGHGKWGQWLRRYLPDLSAASVSRYTRVALRIERREDVEGKGVQEVYRLLGIITDAATRTREPNVPGSGNQAGRALSGATGLRPVAPSEVGCTPGPVDAGPDYTPGPIICVEAGDAEETASTQESGPDATVAAQPSAEPPPRDPNGDSLGEPVPDSELSLTPAETVEELLTVDLPTRIQNLIRALEWLGTFDEGLRRASWSADSISRLRETMAILRERLEWLDKEMRAATPALQ
jgi:hypothetical protein